MELSLVKQSDNTFMAAFDSDYEKVLKIKTGEIYKCQITKPRSLGHHKKLFALFKLVFDNQERFQHSEDLREQLIIEAGYFETYISLHGEVIKKAKSMSFANMDQFEFSELYERIKDVITIHFRITSEQIEEEIHQYF